MSVFILLRRSSPELEEQEEQEKGQEKQKRPEDKKMEIYGG